MNTKPNIIAGLLIAVGLMLLGIFIGNGFKKFRTLDRSVSVKGLSEIQVTANKVVWPITYNEASNDLQQIYTNTESKNAIIIKFLTDNGISSTEITTSAPSITDRQAELYSNNTQSPFRYSATVAITVITEKVEKVKELLSKQMSLIKQGIAINTTNWQFRTKYMFTNLNEVKPKMIEEATKNARATAEKFAADSESTIGKIKNAYQGQLTIEDRDENTPYIKTLRVVTTIEYMLED